MSAAGSFVRLEEETDAPAAAGLLAKVGLTFSHWRSYGKLIGFGLFTFVFVATDGVTVAVVNSALADQMVAALPVPADKTPYFVTVVLVFVALFTGLGAIGLLSLVAPTGYDNNAPRLMKSPAELSRRYPAIFRLQSAHQNSLEWIAMMAPCFWAASSLDVPQQALAKLSVFILAMRVLYVLFYLLNEDLLRTSCFLFAVTGLIDVGLGGLYPDYFTERYGVAR